MAQQPQRTVSTALPARPDMGHLKKQAKDLLALYRSGDPAAFQRLRAALPAAAGQDDATLAARGLRLHDAQSCIAREYGFASFAELQGFVQARRAQLDDPAQALRHWLGLVYAGDITGSVNGARPAVALRLLQADDRHPALTRLGDTDPWLACAVGDEAALRRATAQDPGWVHRAGGPLQLLPLVAVTHSALVRLPEYRDRLLACARFLMDEAGASPDQSVGNRWPPASLAAPNEGERLSALYGAAGRNHNAVLTRLLLDAGANPDDGESLYHALDNPECTHLLLQAGARVTGTNAMYRVLDLDDLGTLQLLLAHGGDANEPPTSSPSSDWGSPLLWAVRRRRSPAHIAALLAAGAKPDARTQDGTPAHIAALRFGLTEVAQQLQDAMARQGGGTAPALLPADEAFIAACARGDEAAASDIEAAHPGIIGTLSPTQLRLLPELAAQSGCEDAVRTMVTLGWPIETRGGDWDGSALNQAVFRGDAALARFLIDHGADWRAMHGFGDNVVGTLSWASLNQPAPGGDWVGCAQALVSAGMPAVRPDPESGTGGVLLGEQGHRSLFSEEVTEYLLTVGDNASAQAED